MDEAKPGPADLAGTVDRLIGLLGRTPAQDVSAFDRTFLARCLAKCQEVAGAPTPADYLGRLGDDAAEARAFLASLHIGTSEFFRNSLTFAVLEHLVLPRLVGDLSARAALRVWCAGCSSGEEPYSVAILLDELLAGSGGATSCHIFATDSCEAGVVAAREGVYDARAVQNLRRKHLEAYFTRAGDSFTVIPRLRDRVDFSTHHLLDAGTHSPPASIYGDFNLILCCNLLIYYRPEFRQRIIEKLLSCLAPRGYLVLGETERAMVEQFGSLRAVAPPAPVFQKG